MEMDVWHGLTCVFTAVIDDAEAVFKLFLFCKLRYNLEAVSDDSRILRGNICRGLNVLFRNYKKVNGCLRMYVAERYDLIVLINLGRGYFPGNYFAENAV